MTRPRHEIMRDLNTLMAELNAAMQNERAQTERLDDVSPKLKEALDPSTRAQGPIVPRHETHEDLRAKARGYKEPRIPLGQLDDQEKPQRERNYTHSPDPDWDEAVFLGTGDRQ